MRALLVALAALAIAAPVAEASYPGANGKILYTRESDLWTMNADGTAQTNITNSTDLTEFSAAWSPDGSKIVLVGWPPSASLSHLYVINSDGSGRTEITPDLSGPPFNGTARPVDVAWSPDGSTIAFTNSSFCGASGAHLALIDPDGANPRRVLCGWPGADPPQMKSGGASGVSWRPDGLKLAVDGPNTDAFEQRIWTVDPDGTDLTQITPPLGNNPDWAPDGTRIVFDDFDFARLWTVNADGSGRTLFVPGSNPLWSPDGARIAFSTGGDVVSVRPDGSDSTNLTNTPSPAFERPTDWLAIPQNAYPRPKGATPTRVSLVVAYNQCTAPDRTHGPPLAFGSCSNPQRTTLCISRSAPVTPTASPHSTRATSC